VSLTARMAGGFGGGGSAYFYSYVTGTLSDANGHSVSDGSPFNGPPNLEITLPVDAIAGQPFRLHFELRCSNLGPLQAGGSSTFSFSGLPPGAAVVSCQGYVSDQSVASRRSSWGKLKSTYR